LTPQRTVGVELPSHTLGSYSKPWARGGEGALEAPSRAAARHRVTTKLREEFFFSSCGSRNSSKTEKTVEKKIKLTMVKRFADPSGAKAPSPPGAQGVHRMAVRLVRSEIGHVRSGQNKASGETSCLSRSIRENRENDGSRIDRHQKKKTWIQMKHTRKC